jgi:DNA polymerase IV
MTPAGDDAAGDDAAGDDAAGAPRRILLADADAFFVAVARMADPDGAGRAGQLIVGGTRESRGVVCSASYEARHFGVRSGMPIARALRLCPDAVCVPVPRQACSEKSRAIRDVLHQLSPVVESASVDEWYLDLGGTERLYGEPLADTAHRIRSEVQRQTGLAVSLGGGTSRLVAKLAVELAKPRGGSGGSGVHVVPPGTEEAFMLRLALADIPHVGPRFQERLRRVGLERVADVVALDLPALVRLVGEREARWLYDRVRGRDDTPVEPRTDVRSISREETFPVDLWDDAPLERELLRLVTRAAADLRAAGLAARTVTVRLRDADFTTRQGSRTADAPLVTDRAIHNVALAQLRRLRQARRVPARLIGVTLSSLCQDAGADQLALFDVQDAAVRDRDRDRVLARAVDRVRARFGDRGILPATLVTRPDRQP